MWVWSKTGQDPIATAPFDWLSGKGMYINRRAHSCTGLGWTCLGWLTDLCESQVPELCNAKTKTYLAGLSCLLRTLVGAYFLLVSFLFY
jgi:hypothetical protein